MARRPRDAKRSKVYNAETVAEYKVPEKHQGQLKTQNQVTVYAQKILGSSWWEKNFGEIGDVEISFHEARAATAQGNWKMNFPRFSWNKAYIVHELAHIAAKAHLSEKGRRTFDAASHGCEYCHRLLKFWKRWFGRDAWLELKAQFKKRKVKYCMPRAKRAGPVHPNSLKNLIPRKSDPNKPVVSKVTLNGLEAKCNAVGGNGFSVMWGLQRGVRVWFDCRFVGEGSLKQMNSAVDKFLRKHGEELKVLSAVSFDDRDGDHYDRMYELHGILAGYVWDECYDS